MRTATILMSVLLATAVTANAQVLTKSQSCGNLQQMVQSKGRVVVAVVPGAKKVYTSTKPKCGMSSMSVATKVPTRDGWCRIGYTCQYTATRR